VDGVSIVDVPTSQIGDWDTFHDTSAQRLGFPACYGRNMSAWIDCLTYADQDDGMRAMTALPGVRVAVPAALTGAATAIAAMW